MGRTVEARAGLAQLGVATAGPLSFPTPSLLWAETTSAHRVGALELGGPKLRSGVASRPGSRRMVLSHAGSAMDVEFSVPVPEISGAASAVEEAIPGIWVVHGPLGPDHLALLRAAAPDLLVLGNARILLREGEPFVRAVHQLRETVGSAPLIWAPRVALPHRLAYLTYAGIDLLDSTEGHWVSSEGGFVDSTLGTLGPSEKSRRDACACPACQADPQRPLEEHAEWAYATEMRLVRAALQQGRLRELVEARLTAEPLLSQLLRYSDRWLYPLLEERVPVVSSESRTYVLGESFRRPEVRRFRERFLERYLPPPSKEVLLLVPCSQTKPYRNSRSHRRFLRALEGFANLERLHIVSVTSPLGLVPRELEDVFPARHYDIPVTGDWSEPERESVQAALSHMLGTGKYREVIVHLGPDEYAFLRPTLEGPRPVTWTMTGDRATADAALATLSAAVREALRSIPGAVPGGPLAVVREELESIAALQFGREAAARLFAPPTRLAGRPWFQRLTDGRSTDLATWREERGLFHLTVAGAQRMMPTPPLSVEVSEGVVLAGDLFTPGVARSDPLIRIGDAVVLTRNRELVGVGEAALPGPMMTRLTRGLAVRVRHRAHSGIPQAREEVAEVVSGNGPVV